MSLAVSNDYFLKNVVEQSWESLNGAHHSLLEKSYKLLEDKSDEFNWTSQKINYLKLHAQYILFINSIIPNDVANRRMNTYQEQFGQYREITIPKAVLYDFIDHVETVLKPTIPASYGRGHVDLRFYMGSSNPDINNPAYHNILIVPVFNSTQYNVQYEYQWMGINFIALMTDNSSGVPVIQTKYDGSREECLHSIENKLTPEKYILVHSFDLIAQFVQSAASLHSLSINFAKTDDSLYNTLIIRCTDSAGDLLHGTISDAGQSFNEGNLIPPPSVQDEISFP